MKFKEYLKITKTAMREELGKEVLTVREALGITQLELASQVGCHYNAVAAAETGCTPISPERIIAILGFLGVPASRVAELIEYAIS